MNGGKTNVTLVQKTHGSWRFAIGLIPFPVDLGLLLDWCAVSFPELPCKALQVQVL